MQTDVETTQMIKTLVTLTKYILSNAQQIHGIP